MKLSITMAVLAAGLFLSQGAAMAHGRPQPAQPGLTIAQQHAAQQAQAALLQAQQQVGQGLNIAQQHAAQQAQQALQNAQQHPGR